MAQHHARGCPIRESYRATGAGSARLQALQVMCAPHLECYAIPDSPRRLRAWQ